MDLVIDNFAGGGGASTGIERAIGKPVDIAINHDQDAIRMHKVNHPRTKHLCESVWNINPMIECAGRPVDLAWFSPDCKHFSKAKGGKPVEKKIRGLAWVALRWAATVKPTIIVLENVEEFLTWGPVLQKDGKFYPCPKRKGRTFNTFIRALEKHGYAVEWQIISAADYGDTTYRERLFIIARCDGQPIVWPEPTHGDPESEAVRSGQLKPHRWTAEHLDWNTPCHSIFLKKREVKKLGLNIRRPLQPNTLRRIAKGVMKYVVNAADPFIVTYYGDKGGEFRGQSVYQPLNTQTTSNRHGIIMPYMIPLTHQGADRAYDVKKPIPTITGAHRGEVAMVSPYLIGIDHGGAKGACAWDSKKPLTTVTTENRHAMVAAFLMRTMGQSVGSSLKAPAPAFTSKIKDSIVTSHLVKLKGTNIGQDVRKPLQTITAGGYHFGEVRAFLLKYYGTDQDPNLREPLHTITTRDRFGLVMVDGEPHQIIDIGMRMLRPRELFRCQGFEDSYIIDRDIDGRPFTIEVQVKMVGNSVCPGTACALVKANYPVAVQEVAA